MGPGLRDAAAGTGQRGGPDKQALQVSVTTLLHHRSSLGINSTTMAPQHGRGILLDDRANNTRYTSRLIEGLLLINLNLVVNRHVNG